MKIAHVREADNEIQPLIDHLTATSFLSGKAAAKIGLQDLGEVIGILHDLGKTSAMFQRYISSATGLIDKENLDYLDPQKNKGKIDHSSAGAYYVANCINVDESVKQIIEIIILSHHGGLMDFVTPDGRDVLNERLNSKGLYQDLEELVNDLGPEFIKVIESNLNSNKLKKQLDYFTNKFERIDNITVKKYMYGMTIKFLFSALIDADRLDTADFTNPSRLYLKNDKTVDWDVHTKKMEKYISKFQVRNNIDKLRNEISEDCYASASCTPGIFQLTVPTGGGKTISSLRFALEHAKRYKMDRVIYIVPYTSIIDQNANQARLILEEGMEFGSVVLEHHSNLTPEKESSKTKMLSENWDSPVVFTTMVQLLETLFSDGTRSIRRLHNLSNSILIFDEIQSINIKHVYLFNMAMNFFSKYCNSSVVLCTATQPLLDKIDPVSYSLEVEEKRVMIKNVDLLFEKLSRTRLVDLTSNTNWGNIDTNQLMIDELELNHSVLVIVNTKKAAYELTELMQDSGYKFFHLSTNMCPQHRMKVLSDIKESLENQRKKNGKPIACISTQLIEAGVDVDFDCVIRHIAGMDSIVQAAGRCNRNGNMDMKGIVYLVESKDENLAKLDDIKKGVETTKRILCEYKKDPAFFDNDMFSSKTIEMYFSYYFHSRKKEMGYNIKLKEYGVSDNIFNLVSSNQKSYQALLRVHKNSSLKFHFSFRTAGKYFKAIESETQGVIVNYEEGKTIINKLCSSNDNSEKLSLLKIAQRYSVNMYQYQIEEYAKNKIVFETQKGSGIYYLNDQHYDNVFGMRNNPNIQVYIVGGKYEESN